jgi:hypothetical protein
MEKKKEKIKNKGAPKMIFDRLEKVKNTEKGLNYLFASSEVLPPKQALGIGFSTSLYWHSARESLCPTILVQLKHG